MPSLSDLTQEAHIAARSLADYVSGRGLRLGVTGLDDLGVLRRGIGNDDRGLVAVAALGIRSLERRPALGTEVRRCLAAGATGGAGAGCTAAGLAPVGALRANLFQPVVHLINLATQVAHLGRLAAHHFFGQQPTPMQFKGEPAEIEDALFVLAKQLTTTATEYPGAGALAGVCIPINHLNLNDLHLGGLGQLRGGVGGGGRGALAEEPTTCGRFGGDGV